MHPLEAAFMNPQRPSGAPPDEAPAKHAYVVFFTPRSGSSLLTELCDRTGVLGFPGEMFRTSSMFNRQTGSGRFKRVPSTSIEVYADAIRRKFKSPADVFGIEATPYQVLPLLKDGRWWKIFPDLKYCVLIRRDFVAQAVSLYLKSVSGLGHSNSPRRASSWERYSAAPYDASAIYRWIRHILNAEWLIELYIGQAAPLRLVYEDFVADKAGTISRLADHVGVELPTCIDVDQTGHRKLGGDRNAAWAERFREERWRLVQDLERSRGIRRIQMVEKNWPAYVSRLLGLR